MIPFKLPLRTRLKNSLRGLCIVGKKPQYLATAIISGFLTSGLLIWALNFELVRFIIFEAPISLFEKIRFFWDAQLSIYATYSSVQANSIILFATLFGINITLIAYLLRHKNARNIPRKSSGTGLFLALIGVGCIACGTTILAPLLITLGVTSSLILVTISMWINWFGSLLIVYSIYRLGDVISNTQKNI